MSHFEYISVAASLVYSLALARLLGAIPAALDPGRRYWVHAIWLVNLLFATVGSWWQIWAYREAEWSPAGFLSLLAIPSIILLRATVLIGSEPGRVECWRAHYYRARRPFFLLQVAGSANYMAAPWLILEVQLPPNVVASAIAFASLGVLLAASAAPRLHGAFAILCLVGFVVALFSPTLPV